MITHLCNRAYLNVEQFSWAFTWGKYEACSLLWRVLHPVNMTSVRDVPSGETNSHVGPTAGLVFSFSFCLPLGVTGTANVLFG